VQPWGWASRGFFCAAGGSSHHSHPRVGHLAGLAAHAHGRARSRGALVLRRLVARRGLPPHRQKVCCIMAGASYLLPTRGWG